MTWSVLVIAVLGAALARLNQTDVGGEADTPPERDVTIDVPDDLWAAFEAAGDIDGRRTTVGGMAPGDSGFVALEAAARDEDGTLWLDAAAVVHPTMTPERVALRRDVDGFWLQRRRGASPGRASGRPPRARVPIHDLFD